MEKSKIKGPIFCIAAAVIWGLSFVAQKAGASAGTLTFNGIRLLLGGLVLIPAVVISHKHENKQGEKKPFDFKGVVRGGLACGAALFAGTNLQQHAFTFDIAAGKVAFITALYMILVPVFGIFLHKRAGLNIWIGVALGMAGLYFICMMGGGFGKIGHGELFALACAVCFAVHIRVVDYFCTKVNNVALSCAQFLVAGIASLILMPFFEDFDIHVVLSNSVTILYAGLASCALGFTFQIFGQKTTDPALASLLMCLESVFAAIFGWLILGDILTSRVLLGCVIMFTGIVVTQIPVKEKRK